MDRRRRKPENWTREARLEVFWSRVRRGGPEECWPYIGGKTAKGYGQFEIEPDKMVHAHRLALIATHGPIPDAMQACHTCDNPPCCNPAHLFAGTAFDNTRDCINKGRARKAHGANHRSSKLAGQVVAICQEYGAGAGVQAIARKYGVAPNAIKSIVSGLTYKDMQVSRPAIRERAKARHGSRSLYAKGCRCDLCKDAHNRYMREYNARFKEAV